jgi:hypothetical protein
LRARRADFQFMQRRHALNHLSQTTVLILGTILVGLAFVYVLVRKYSTKSMRNTVFSDLVESGFPIASLPMYEYLLQAWDKRFPDRIRGDVENRQLAHLATHAPSEGEGSLILDQELTRQVIEEIADEVDRINSLPSPLSANTDFVASMRQILSDPSSAWFPANRRGTLAGLIDAWGRDNADWPAPERLALMMVAAKALPPVMAFRIAVSPQDAATALQAIDEAKSTDAMLAQLRAQLDAED